MFLPDAPRETHETFAARCVHAVLEDTTVHRRRLAGGVDGNGSGGSGGSGAAGGGGGCDGGGGGGGADGDGGRGRGGGGDGGGGDGGNGDRGGGEIVVEVVPMVMAVMINERSKKARTTETCRGANFRMIIHEKRDLHQVSLSLMYICRLQMSSNIITSVYSIEILS